MVAHQARQPWRHHHGCGGFLTACMLPVMSLAFAIREAWPGYARLFGLLLTALLAACADESNLDQPAELAPLDTPYYLDVDWLASTGQGPDEQYLFLQPLLLESIAVSASRDGVLTLIDRHSGEFVDDIDLDTSISAGVGGDESLWLVAAEDAEVIAIDAESRRPRWRTRVASEVLSLPKIVGDSVLGRTIDGRIISLDKHSGKLRWQYQRTIPDLTLRGTGELLVLRGMIIAGLADGRLIALSPDKGEVLWDVALAVPKGRSEIQRLVDIDGYLAVYGRILYAVSYQGRLAAIDVERGQFLWARDFSSYSGLQVDDKAVYLSDDHGFVWALDRFNGATLWKQTKLAWRKLTRPTLIGNYLAVGDFEGYVHLLDASDGHFIARYQLGQFDHPGWDTASGIIVPPIVFDAHRLLVIARGGMAYLLSLKKNDLDL